MAAYSSVGLPLPSFYAKFTHLEVNLADVQNHSDQRPSKKITERMKPDLLWQEWM